MSRGPETLQGAVGARYSPPCTPTRFAQDGDAVIKRMFFFTMCCRASVRPGSFRPRSRAHDAGLSPCAQNTIREAISRDTPSGPRRLHAFRKSRTRSAAGTFSGHRQRSQRICHQKCGCPVSATTSGSSTPRDHACFSGGEKHERPTRSSPISRALTPSTWDRPRAPKRSPAPSRRSR